MGLSMGLEPQGSSQHHNNTDDGGYDMTMVYDFISYKTTPCEDRHYCKYAPDVGK